MLTDVDAKINAVPTAKQQVNLTSYLVTARVADILPFIEDRQQISSFSLDTPNFQQDLETAHLSTRELDILSHNCLPGMQQRQRPCFTMFTDNKGNKYRAHPCYDGKAWNDSAMVA
jgi:hypothetical protein